MKHVKSLFILSEGGVTSFPIESILFVKLNNKLIDIRFTDGREERYPLRLTNILNCVFDLTNYSQFFFGIEGILFNPLHTEIVKYGKPNLMEYELIPRTNMENIKYTLPAKEVLHQLAKSKLIIQNESDSYAIF
jgi:hypothetical protein